MSSHTYNTVARTLAVLVAVATVASVGACTGRNPSVAKNDDAQFTPPPPPPPPPVPEKRTLQHKALFGTMPVTNRFQDPLMTFTGYGWFAFSNDFQSYPTLKRSVSSSPTATPFVSMAPDENPGGATLIGQLKTARTPLHVEVWLGRVGEDGDLATAGAQLAGLFAGGGEQITSLEPDASSKVVVAGNTWEKFTVDMPEGPIGWSYLLAADAAAPSHASTLLVGGAVAVDVPATAGGAFVTPHARALTVHERALIESVQEKTRTLAMTTTKQPSPLPGLPPLAPR